MIKSQWIELQCRTCESIDRMPLDQYERYLNFTCPYERNNKRCSGSLETLKVRTLEFMPEQINLFTNTP